MGKRMAGRDEREERPRRRWGLRLVIGLVLVAAAVYLAPSLVARLGLWRALLARAAPPLAGKIDAERVSLGWFSPVVVEGVVVRDASAQPLAGAAAVRSRKSLLDLALTYPNLGYFVVERPRASVVLRDGGSNVEDFLASLKLPAGDSAEPVFGLEIAEGSVELDDQLAGRQWVVQGIAADVAWPAAGQARTGKLTAAIVPKEAAAGDAAGRQAAGGQIAASFSWQPGADGSLGSGQGAIGLGNVPSEAAVGALRRLIGDIQMQGGVTLDAAVAWNDAEASRQLTINQLTTPGLSIAAPAYLGSDQPMLVIAAGQGDVRIAGDKIAIDQLVLDSNLVQIRGQGTARSSALAPAALVASQEDADIDLRGQINLAELARQLPATLRLRPGTEVRSGLLDVSLVSRRDAQGQQWQAGLRTEQLQATSGGAAVDFREPLAIDVVLRNSPQGVVIERLDGRASFLHMQGQGTLAGGSITASADLSRLAQELGRVIDWGDTRLAGSLEGRLRWNRGEGDSWTASADGVVRSFELAAAGMTVWKEPHLVVSAETAGVLREGALAQVSSGRLVVESGADRLDAELTEPVAAPSLDSVWPVGFTLRGELATWTPRLQPVVSLRGINMAGAIDAGGSGRFSPRASELVATKVQIDRLAVDGLGLSIREPIVKIETSGAWDHPQRTLTLGSTTLASSAVAFRADGLRLVASNEPSVVGLIDFRGDLARLSSWLSDPQQPPASQLGGALTGRVEIGYRGQTLSGTWQADVENFAYHAAHASAAAPAGQPVGNLVWEEPRIHLSGQGTYDPAAARLQVERTTLAASCASVAVAGSIQLPFGEGREGSFSVAPQTEVDLRGEVAYDLVKIEELLKTHVRRSTPRDKPLPYGLDTLKLAGQERRTFTLKGPLHLHSRWPRSRSSSAEVVPAGHVDSPQTATTGRGYAEAPGRGSAEALVGEMTLGWQAAEYVGLVAGAADVPVRLAGGVVHVGPLDMPISEGRLKAAPRLLLNEPTPLVVMERGPLVENVRISPEMCHLWLKYVAPLVAEATRAQGTLSVSLEGAAVPAFAPSSGEVVGTLQIHAAQVGPGPLALQYLSMARQVRSLFDANAGAATAIDPDRGWLILPEQGVPFEMRGGAVHHRGLTMTVGDVKIVTSGSVQVETQELNLLASIPLEESWFKRKDGVFAPLRGQTLVVPIRGTLSRPQLDGKVLEGLGKQLAGAAVQGALDRQLDRGQQLLDRGLDRLFGPMPKPQPAVPVQPTPQP